jgi:nitrite reductase/ring-hydroxylating ferredoxin subunit
VVTVRLCSDSDIVDNSVRRFAVERKEIPVGKLAGKYYALDERCTHRGGPCRKGLLRVELSHALGIMDNLISQQVK